MVISWKKSYSWHQQQLWMADPEPTLSMPTYKYKEIFPTSVQVLPAPTLSAGGHFHLISALRVTEQMYVPLFLSHQSKIYQINPLL